MALVSTVALLTAAFLLLARIFKLGFLADFLSRTVLVGFLAGVGLQVGIAMLGDMLGVTAKAHNALVRCLAAGACVTPRQSTHRRARRPSCGRNPARQPPHPPHPAAARGGPRHHRRERRRSHFTAHGIAVIGPVPGGLPVLGLPAVTWSESPHSPADRRVMLCHDHRAKRRNIARLRVPLSRNRQRGRRHILGLAAANTAAAISGTFVVNGSPTQTAMADRAGARSQVAQLVFAAMVLLVLLLPHRTATISSPLRARRHRYLPSRLA